MVEDEFEICRRYRTIVDKANAFGGQAELGSDGS